MTDDQIPLVDKAFVELNSLGFEAVLLFRNRLGSVAAIALDGVEEVAVMQAVSMMDDLDVRITDHASVTHAINMLATKLRDGGVAWTQLIEKLMPSMHEVTKEVESIASMIPKPNRDDVIKMLCEGTVIVEGRVE
jgi:hypothetical protein